MISEDCSTKRILLTCLVLCFYNFFCRDTFECTKRKSQMFCVSTKRKSLFSWSKINGRRNLFFSGSQMASNRLPVSPWNPPGPASTAVRPDKIKVWEMKKPHPPELWMPNSPKRLHAKGPGNEIPLGAFRVGPDCVGPVAEFAERRVKCLKSFFFHEDV